MKRLTALFLLALTAMLACQASWAQELPSDYQMSVVLDRAHGDVVAKGREDRAILRINTQQSRVPYARAGTLCGAHTMVGRYGEGEV